MPKATLIISVYKNTAALRAILDSLQQQTEQDFEIIISEDGEDTAMAAFIAGYPFRQPVQHLTQPDQGWRKDLHSFPTRRSSDLVLWNTTSATGNAA